MSILPTLGMQQRTETKADHIEKERDTRPVQGYAEKAYTAMIFVLCIGMANSLAMVCWVLVPILEWIFYLTVIMPLEELRRLFLFIHPMPRETRMLKNQLYLLDYSDTYTEWKSLATSIENNLKLDQWRKECTLGEYSHSTVEHFFSELLYSVERHDISLMLSALDHCLAPDFANIDKQLINSRSLIGTKCLIEEYIQIVLICLSELKRGQLYWSCTNDHIEALKQLRHQTGNTALVFTGGFSRASRHLGVMRSLMDVDMLPRIISGSAGGALVAACCIAVYHKLPKSKLDFDERMRHIDLMASYYDNSVRTRCHVIGSYSMSFVRQVSNMSRRLTMAPGYDSRKCDYFFRDMLRSFLGDMTFLDLYRKTGRFLNISIETEDPSDDNESINMLTSPKVVIWSAIMASCGLYAGVLETPQDGESGCDIRLYERLKADLIPWGGSHRISPTFFKNYKPTDPYDHSLGTFFHIKNYIIAKGDHFQSQSTFWVSYLVHIFSTFFSWALFQIPTVLLAWNIFPLTMIRILYDKKHNHDDRIVIPQSNWYLLEDIQTILYGLAAWFIPESLLTMCSQTIWGRQDDGTSNYGLKIDQNMQRDGQRDTWSRVSAIHLTMAVESDLNHAIYLRKKETLKLMKQDPPNDPSDSEGREEDLTKEKAMIEQMLWDIDLDMIHPKYHITFSALRALPSTYLL